MARRIPTPAPPVDERELEWLWSRLAWVGPDPRYFLRADQSPECLRAEVFREEMTAVRDDLSELPLPDRVDAFREWLEAEGFGDAARRMIDSLRAARERAAEESA